MRDYSKLRGLIKEKLGNERKYANCLNLSEASISAKLNGKVPFSLEEIDKTIILLNIAENEICQYFFTKKVEKKSTI